MSQSVRAPNDPIENLRVGSISDLSEFVNSFSLSCEYLFDENDESIQSRIVDCKDLLESFCNAIWDLAASDPINPTYPSHGTTHWGRLSCVAQNFFENHEFKHKKEEKYVEGLLLLYIAFVGHDIGMAVVPEDIKVNETDFFDKYKNRIGHDERSLKFMEKWFFEPGGILAGRDRSNTEIFLDAWSSHWEGWGLGPDEAFVLILRICQSHADQDDWLDEVSLTKYSYKTRDQQQVNLSTNWNEVVYFASALLCLFDLLDIGLGRYPKLDQKYIDIWLLKKEQGSRGKKTETLPYLEFLRHYFGHNCLINIIWSSSNSITLRLQNSKDLPGVEYLFCNLGPGWAAISYGNSPELKKHIKGSFPKFDGIRCSSQALKDQKPELDRLEEIFSICIQSSVSKTKPACLYLMLHSLVDRLIQDNGAGSDVGLVFDNSDKRQELVEEVAPKFWRLYEKHEDLSEMLIGNLESNDTFQVKSEKTTLSTLMKVLLYCSNLLQSQNLKHIRFITMADIAKINITTDSRYTLFVLRLFGEVSDKNQVVKLSENLGLQSKLLIWGDLSSISSEQITDLVGYENLENDFDQIAESILDLKYSEGLGQVLLSIDALFLSRAELAQTMSHKVKEGYSYYLWLLIVVFSEKQSDNEENYKQFHSLLPGYFFPFDSIRTKVNGIRKLSDNNLNKLRIYLLKLVVGKKKARLIAISCFPKISSKERLLQIILEHTESGKVRDEMLQMFRFSNAAWLGRAWKLKPEDDERRKHLNACLSSLDLRNPCSELSSVRGFDKMKTVLQWQIVYRFCCALNQLEFLSEWFQEKYDNKNIPSTIKLGVFEYLISRASKMPVNSEYPEWAVSFREYIENNVIPEIKSKNNLLNSFIYFDTIYFYSFHRVESKHDLLKLREKISTNEFSDLFNTSKAFRDEYHSSIDDLSFCIKQVPKSDRKKLQRYSFRKNFLELLSDLPEGYQRQHWN